MPQSIPDLPRKAAAGEITGTAGSSDRRGITRLGPDWSSGYRTCRRRPSQAIDTASSSATTVSNSRRFWAAAKVLETQFQQGAPVMRFRPVEATTA